MNKLLAKIGICSLLMGLSVSSWAGPCRPIVKACHENGFTAGGAQGKHLLKDCVLPVAFGNKTLPGATFTDQQLNDCKIKLREKIKNKMQGQQPVQQQPQTQQQQPPQQQQPQTQQQPQQ